MSRWTLREGLVTLVTLCKRVGAPMKPSVLSKWMVRVEVATAFPWPPSIFRLID